MTEIDEIGADHLERWIGIAGRVRADRKGDVAEYVDWKRQAEDMVWLVASKDGEDAGAALAYVGWHSKPGTGHGEVFVLPELRGVGVGSELYARVGAWVQERGCVVLETAVAEDDAGSLAWVDRRGFREVGRNSKMVLDLTAIEAPEIDPPDGVEIVTWAERPELASGLYAVACEAYPDVPGEESTLMDAYEEWLSIDMQGDSDRPDATFIALVDGEVAGYAKLALSRSDPKVAYHDMTGVRREFRGRGIAGALKRTQIRWAKEAGYEKLQTANEVRNAPIRALNQRHGYKLEPGLVILLARSSSASRDE
jgi:GNAT superfamily N-acetyltransferase